MLHDVLNNDIHKKEKNDLKLTNWSVSSGVISTRSGFKTLESTEIALSKRLSR